MSSVGSGVCGYSEAEGGALWGCCDCARQERAEKGKGCCELHFDDVNWYGDLLRRREFEKRKWSKGEGALSINDSRIKSPHSGWEENKLKKEKCVCCLK